MARSMNEMINRTFNLLESVGDYSEWQGELDKARDERESSMIEYTRQVTGMFDGLDAEASANKFAMVESRLNAHGVYATPIDPVNFPVRKELCGPFRYRTGAVLYVNPQTANYYNPVSGMEIGLAEALEIMGISTLIEDENRSDSEFAVFFDDKQTALSAYRMAQSLGLTSGEVTYDQTVNPSYGLGNFAVRFAPHVRETKTEKFLQFMEAMHDYIEIQDRDQFEWVAEVASTYLLEYGGKGKKDLKKIGKKGDSEGVPGKLPYAPMPKFNVNHAADDGKFTSRKRVRDGGGSASDGCSATGKYKCAVKKTDDQKHGKSKGKALQFKASSLPCGRAGREKGTYFLCSKPGQKPAWYGK